LPIANLQLHIEKQQQKKKNKKKQEEKEAHGQDARATHGRDAHATNNSGKLLASFAVTGYRLPSTSLPFLR